MSDVTEEPTAAVEPDPPESADDIQASLPDFAMLSSGEPGDGTPIERFYGVNVSVWAELGRASMSLGELLKVGAGSVLKLDRPVSAPVDLMAQGVRVARGEVVVVDDYFAVRIKEIESSRQTEK